MQGRLNVECCVRLVMVALNEACRILLKFCEGAGSSANRFLLLLFTSLELEASL